MTTKRNINNRIDGLEEEADREAKNDVDDVEVNIIGPDEEPPEYPDDTHVIQIGGEL